MTSFERDILSFVKSGIDKSVTEISKEFEWERAISVLKEHKLLQLAYYGISNSKIELPENIKSIFMQFVFHNVRFDQIQKNEFEALECKFSEKHIQYMPLKGIILKSIYPSSEMRPMADIDILINNTQIEVIKNTMNELGFELKKETHHEFRFKKGNLLVELHKSLVPSYDKDYYSYYDNGWRFAKKVSDSDCKYNMKKEDFFVFLIVHFAKHYRDGGISVLHLTDMWVYQRAYKLDIEYLKAELEKLGLYKFYLNIKETIDCWYNGKENSEMSDFITTRMFDNGMWGTEQSHFASAALRNSPSRKTAKIKRLFQIIFPSVDYLKFRYPVLQRHKYLLPVFWIKRLFETVLKKGDRIDSVSNSFKNTDDEYINNYLSELKYVGLNFNNK